MSFMSCQKAARYCVTGLDQRFVLLNTLNTVRRRPAIAYVAETSLLFFILALGSSRISLLKVVSGGRAPVHLEKIQFWHHHNFQEVSQFIVLEPCTWKKFNFCMLFDHSLAALMHIAPAIDLAAGNKGPLIRP